MAPIHLHTQVGGFKTGFGDEGLGDGRQQGQQLIGGLGVVLTAGVHDVALLGKEVQQCAAAFHKRFLRQQHTAHVGVHDNGVRGAIRVFRAGEAAHGQTVARIGQRALVGQFTVRQALDCGADTRRVHEGEHGVQTAVGRADQVSGSTVEVQHTGRRGLDPHLLFDGGAVHAVALTQAAIVVHIELGHDKQGNALGALGRVGEARQHDVHDVLGHIVLTGTDKDFGAGDGVAAIRLRLGLGAQQAQVTAAMGFGQAHGARPAALDQARQVLLLLRLVAVLFDRFDGAVAEPGVHEPGPVGGACQFVGDNAEQIGHALTAVSGVGRQRRPAVGHELLVGLGETLGRGDNAILPATTLFITRLVKR